MARPREFQEEAVVGAVAQTFWRRGFTATSIRGLEAETGVGAASLYNAFGDKRAIFRRALEAYAEAQVRPRIRRLEALPPTERIHAFVGEVVASLADEEGGASCLVVNTAMELAAGDDDIRSDVAACLGEVEDFLRRALEQAVASGDIAPEREPATLARGLMSMLLGLHIQARLRPGVAALGQATRPMLSLIPLPDSTNSDIQNQNS